MKTFVLEKAVMVENGTESELLLDLVEHLFLPMTNIYRGENEYVITLPEAFKCEDIVIPYEREGKKYSFDIEFTEGDDKANFIFSFLEIELEYVLCAVDDKTVAINHEETNLELPSIVWRGGQMIFTYKHPPTGDVNYNLGNGNTDPEKYSTPTKMVYNYEEHPKEILVVINNRRFVFRLAYDQISVKKRA